jgi:hypothetical protein
MDYFSKIPQPLLWRDLLAVVPAVVLMNVGPEPYRSLLAGLALAAGSGFLFWLRRGRWLLISVALALAGAALALILPQ